MEASALQGARPWCFLSRGSPTLSHLRKAVPMEFRDVEEWVGVLFYNYACVCCWPSHLQEVGLHAACVKKNEHTNKGVEKARAAGAFVSLTKINHVLKVFFEI